MIVECKSNSTASSNLIDNALRVQKLPSQYYYLEQRRFNGFVTNQDSLSQRLQIMLVKKHENKVGYIAKHPNSRPTMELT